MPGGDCTGPFGTGPGTGRAMSYCGGYNQPGFANTALGFRGGFGFRHGGMARGWRHRFYATGVPGWAALTPEQEASDLKAQAERLKGQFDVIQKRIEELESK